MNAHRMDQETVERLLVGPVAGAQDGPEALVRLLTAVRAAPRPHELSGEGAALRAFRMARAGAVPVAASRPERRILAGLLSAKVALAALLVAATGGGVALAAATGTLPGPLGGGDGTTAPSASAGGQPFPTGGPGVSPTPAAGPSDRPGLPALLGLCTAYRAVEGDNRRRALETPRFADLVSTAGGREKVAGYCDRLLDGRDRPNGPATDRPGDESTGKVTGHPEHSPATTEGGRPGSSVNQPASVPASPR